MIIEAMHESSQLSNQLPTGAVALTHLGVIRVEGEDAAKFIHGQLTQDFSLLGQDQARLAAFCSAKGRMLASFIGFKRSPTDILLLCNLDLLPATLKRLAMFVLRAKAKLSDATGEFMIYGESGVESATPWNIKQEGEATVIALYPAGNIARQIRVAPVGTPVPDLAPIAADLWAWGDVASGVAMISVPVIDAFVPQMLNYESVGGVNFKKGCYPGQEVVARSQFRGTLKRRGFIISGATPMQAGQEIFAPDDDSQPVGLVVQAAASPSGDYWAIASLQIAAAQAGQLRLGSNTGGLLNLLLLPYQLLEDI
jgi:folate-binding protein YgfZ